jgi:hypothetical protein
MVSIMKKGKVCYLYLPLKLQEITTNIRQGLSLQNPATGKHVEIDIFIPELNLCFEFQVCEEEKNKKKPLIFTQNLINFSFPFHSISPLCIVLLYLFMCLQDTYHYMTMWYSQRSATSMRDLDNILLSFFSFFSFLIFFKLQAKSYPQRRDDISACSVLVGWCIGKVLC